MKLYFDGIEIDSDDESEEAIAVWVKYCRFYTTEELMQKLDAENIHGKLYMARLVQGG